MDTDVFILKQNENPLCKYVSYSLLSSIGFFLPASDLTNIKLMVFLNIYCVRMLYLLHLGNFPFHLKMSFNLILAYLLYTCSSHIIKRPYFWKWLHIFEMHEEPKKNELEIIWNKLPLPSLLISIDTFIFYNISYTQWNYSLGLFQVLLVTIILFFSEDLPEFVFVTLCISHFKTLTWINFWTHVV